MMVAANGKSLLEEVYSTYCLWCLQTWVSVNCLLHTIKNTLYHTFSIFAAMVNTLIMCYIHANSQSLNYLLLQDGWTALHVACEKGHDEVVQTLLRAKADLNLQNIVGSYLHYPTSV